jgi:hypothetical protein
MTEKFNSIGRYVGLSIASIMIVLYCTLLVHIQRGNKNKWVTLVTVLLLVSMVAYFMFMLANFLLLELKFIKTPKAVAWLIVLGISKGIQSSAFNVAHFLLADKYWQMSIQVPLKLEGKDPKESTTC